MEVPQQELKLTESDFVSLRAVVRYDFECSFDPICGILARPENEGYKVGPDTFFPNTTTAKYESPFIAAAQFGNVKFLRHFLTHYGDAIDMNRTGTCTFIDQDSRSSADEITLHDCTALNAACCGDNLKIEVVELLVSRGASVNFPNCGKNTPLMGAANSGNVEVMEYLITKGAKVNDANVKGHTALCRAAIKGHSAAIALLLKKGADIDHRIIRGPSAVHLAAMDGHLEAERLLLESGASHGFCEVDSSKADYVPPPLLLAASEGQKELVGELLGHPLCTLELRIDALLLLGGAIFVKSKTLTLRNSELKSLWRTALTLRETSTTVPNFLPPAGVYGYRVEVRTSADLDDIMDSSIEILYQVLIIHERCMGQVEPGLAKEISLIKVLIKQHYFVEAEFLWTRQMEKMRNVVSFYSPEIAAYRFTHGMLSILEKYFRAFRSILKSIIQYTKGEHPSMKPYITFALSCFEYMEAPPLSPSCEKPDCNKLLLLVLAYFHLWCCKQEEKRKANREGVDDVKQSDLDDYETLGQQFVSKCGHSSNHDTLLLHSAIKAKWFEIIESLLRWGADESINTPNSDGLRPLHVAIRHRNLEIIMLLLDNGAHLDAVDGNGQTIIDLSDHLRMREIHKVLVSNPLPLSCHACRMIVEKGIPYEQLDLPPHMKKLIRLHDKQALHH